MVDLRYYQISNRSIKAQSVITLFEQLPATLKELVLAHHDMQEFIFTDINLDKDFNDPVTVSQTILDILANPDVELREEILKIKAIEYENLSIPFIPKGFFSSFPNLKVISINSCQTIEIERGAFNIGLEELDLSKNNIQWIEEDLLTGLINLVSFSIADNNLIKVPENLFKGLISISVIAIDNNKLTKLPETLFENLVFLNSLSIFNSYSVDQNLITNLSNKTFAGLINLDTLTIRSADKSDELFNQYVRDLLHVSELKIALATTPLRVFGVRHLIQKDNMPNVESIHQSMLQNQQQNNKLDTEIYFQMHMNTMQHWTGYMFDFEIPLNSKEAEVQQYYELKALMASLNKICHQFTNPEYIHERMRYHFEESLLAIEAKEPDLPKCFHTIFTHALTNVITEQKYQPSKTLLTPVEL